MFSPVPQWVPGKVAGCPSGFGACGDEYPADVHSGTWHLHVYMAVPINTSCRISAWVTTSHHFLADVYASCCVWTMTNYNYHTLAAFHSCCMGRHVDSAGEFIFSSKNPHQQLSSWAHIHSIFTMRYICWRNIVLLAVSWPLYLNNLFVMLLICCFMPVIFKICNCNMKEFCILFLSVELLILTQH